MGMRWDKVKEETQIFSFLCSSVVRASDWYIQKVIGSIPIGDSDFFFVPCS